MIVRKKLKVLELKKSSKRYVKHLNNLCVLLEIQ